MKPFSDRTLTNMLVKMQEIFKNKGSTILNYSLMPIPFSMKKIIIERLLQLQFEHALADGDLDFLENRWLKIEVKDLDLVWFTSLIDEKLVVSRLEKYDVSFCGNMNDLILIATRRQDPDTLFFQRRLIVEGDTELGLAIKNLMDSIDLDNMPKWMLTMLNKMADCIESKIEF